MTMKSEEQTFGSELRKLRRANGKTLEDIADMWGVSIPHVSDIERGRRSPPARPLIMKLLTATDRMDLLDLFTDLSLRHRGEFQRKIRNEDEQRVLVALQRALDDDLTSDDYAKLLDLLNTIKEKNNG